VGDFVGDFDGTGVGRGDGDGVVGDSISDVQIILLSKPHPVPPVQPSLNSCLVHNRPPSLEQILLASNQLAQ